MTIRFCSCRISIYVAILSIKTGNQIRRIFSQCTEIYFHSREVIHRLHGVPRTEPVTPRIAPGVPRTESATLRIALEALRTEPAAPPIAPGDSRTPRAISLQPCLSQGNSQIVCQPFPHRNRFRGKLPFAPVIQLEKTQPLLTHTQSDQGYGFIPFAVTSVARAGLTVSIGRGCQQFRGAVGPETSPRCEERLRWVEPSADNVAAHAFMNRVAVIIADKLPGASRAQRLFSNFTNSSGNPHSSRSKDSHRHP